MTSRRPRRLGALPSLAAAIAVAGLLVPAMPGARPVVTRDTVPVEAPSVTRPEQEKAPMQLGPSDPDELVEFQSSSASPVELSSMPSLRTWPTRHRRGTAIT